MTTPNPEFHEAQLPPFDRAACVRNSVYTFRSPGILLPLGANGYDVESHYLPNDVYPVDRGTHTTRHIGSVGAAVYEWALLRGDIGESLTDEALQELSDDARSHERAFGRTVVERFADDGIVTTLTPEAAEAAIKQAPRSGIRQDLSSIYGDFAKGWAIFEDNDGAPLLLVTRPQEGDVEDVVLDAVSLDLAHDIDDAFLEQLILDYHVAREKQTIANVVTYNLGIHALSDAEFRSAIPEHLYQLGEIRDDEERAAAMQSILVFHDWIMHGNDELGRRAFEMTANERTRSVTIDGGSRTVPQQELLEHSAECPTQALEARMMSHELSVFYKGFQSIHYDPPEPEARVREHDTIQLLGEYPSHILNTERSIARSHADIAESMRAIGVIDLSRHSDNGHEFLQNLARVFPSYHETLVAFEQWLGESGRYSTVNTLNKLLESAIRRMPHDKDVTADEMLKLVSHELHWASSRAPQFDGISIPQYSDREPYISNHHLRVLLPILAAKARRNDTPRYGLSLTPERCEDQDIRIANDLARAERKNIDFKRDYIESATVEREKFEALYKKLGISDEELATIRVLSERERHDGRRGVSNMTYSALLNALILHKKGYIDMATPTFVSYLEDLLDNRYPSARDDFSALLEIGPSPQKRQFRVAGYIKGLLQRVQPSVS